MHLVWRAYLCAALTLAAAAAAQQGDVAMTQEVPENTYRGELLTYPGPWAFTLGRPHIILVRDDQLEGLTDPDRVVDLSLTHTPRHESLRQICEKAQQHGQRTLVFSFDHFFAQYNPGLEGKTRALMPDMDEYIERMAVISRTAQEYGIGLELSLLSPLEIGRGYRAATGESGLWMHYRKGLRDPETGAFSVQFWRQSRWANNKGPIDIEDAGVRVFAFREGRVGGTPYRVVNPEDIVEITDVAQVEAWPATVHKAGDYRATRVRVFGEGRADVGDLDRVLVVQQYRTPEMDYFSDKAQPYLRDLVDKYADAGVKLNALYSDEMHIQQDWAYFSHHDHGNFALRYVSPGLAQQYAARYGERYRDLAKYMIYFTYGQDDFVQDLSATEGTMHVFGDTPEAIRETALFRSRYFELLQDGVVDLFVQAKRHAEQRMGYKLLSRAHATWAESPTIDRWRTGQAPHYRSAYEYTPNFVWSCTVHQASAACHDYFKWGDFLTGNGNDHAECGWLDRNYYGLALGCSTGILNEIPYSYAAHWGMPAPIRDRRTALVNAYGAFAQPDFAMVQGAQHRDVDVLMLYPLDLVAAEERFGSWMNQYGYANLITQAKLLERGTVADGAIDVAGYTFTTLAATFEPFPSARLLDMMQKLAESGGRVIWSGPPPVLSEDGASALEAWQALTGVDYTPGQDEGVRAPGKQVVFEGVLADVPPMTILTDFMVDRVYPVTPREGVSITARVRGDVAGTHRTLEGGGTVTFIGFRPRDDQSMSLGYDERHWFDILDALGAYPGTGAFPGENDNTEYLSRTGDYLMCRFLNGAVAVAPHLRHLEEDWPGGFARKEDEDAVVLERIALPSDEIHLRDAKINGHTVTYDGSHAMTFRVSEAGELIAFAGRNCSRITIDGRTTVFADQPMGHLAWAPVDESRRVEGGALMQIQAAGPGPVRIPLVGLPDAVHLVAQGPTPGSRGKPIESRVEDGRLVFEKGAWPWIYVVPGAAEGDG